MSKMSELEMVITDLRKAAEVIKEAADTLSEMFGGTSNEASDDVVADREKVRSVFQNLSRIGYGEELKALLQKYGTDHLTGLAPEHFDAILKDAEVLQNAT